MNEMFLIGALMSIPPCVLFFKPFGVKLQAIVCMIQTIGLVLMLVNLFRLMSA